MLLSLESYVSRRRLRRAYSGGHASVPQIGQGRIGRPGSETMCKRELGFPRNLGDPVVSTEEFPDGDTE